MHFVCEGDGWALDKTVNLLIQHLPGATRAPHLRHDADVNVYFPYYELKQKGPSIDVALYTHMEPAGKKRAWWDESIALADRCIGMSKATLALLPEGSELVELPADPRFMLNRKIRFGVCGRSYINGRKKDDWLASLSTMPGTEWYVTRGEVSDEQMPGFYGHIDYLVVLSNNEGGPLPLKEAMLAGKPVIAPNVGWAWEYPVIRYHDYDGLLDIIRKLVPHDKTKEAARQLNSVCWRMVNKEQDNGTRLVA